MASILSSTRPAWQTEELQEEWVDLDEQEERENENDSILTYGTRSISFTAPLTTQIHTNCDTSHVLSTSPGPSTAQVGTFLIREDQPSLQINLKTPGQKNKGLIKDFFSPLPLERMFEPPSPPRNANASTSVSPTTPAQSLPQAISPDEGSPDQIVETDLPGMVSFHGHKSRMTHRFTFSVPRSNTGSSSMAGSSFPIAQSTPTRPGGHLQRVPATDSRLKLFRFQYDTYTREQLSALVDSIAVNSGSAVTPSPTTVSRPLSRLSEASSSAPDDSHLRSAKRIKLSPPSDFLSEERGNVGRPLPSVHPRDYVGESRSLMQQIRQARDASIVSSALSVEPTPQPSPREEQIPPSKLPSALQSVSTVPSSTAASTPTRPYTSASYRQKAEALMSQIKKDMKGNKRIFSGDTAASAESPGLEDKFNVSQPSFAGALSSPENSLPRRSPKGGNNSKPRRAGPKKQRSPIRKPVRHLSTSTLDSQLSEEISQLSLRDVLPPAPPSPVQKPPTLPSNLAPATDPTSTSRTKTDDLIRFVSSSTATGSTLTAGRAPSYSKHSGPAHIRTIAPTDLPELPEKLGDMLFDKVMMKWVKNTGSVTAFGQSSGSSEDASDDPFRDIESLRDDSRRSSELADEDDEEPLRELRQAEMTRIEEQPEFDDEELELNSFSTDDPSALVVDVMTGVETVDEGDETTDSEEEDDADHQPQATGEINDYDSDDVANVSSVKQTMPAIEIIPTTPPASPAPHKPSTHSQSQAIATPGPKPVLKSRSATPQSVLKNPNRIKYETPSNKIPRSVSFSDGKRDGPIRGLAGSTNPSEHNTSTDLSPVDPINANASQSARSKRIAQMLDALEDDESDTSPSKQSTTRHPGSSPGKRRSFTRSRSQQFSVTQNGNATFLTECSFAVSHDRLVEVITDVQPFVPHWDQLSSIDLSGKKLESVARLKEFLPRLDSLVLNANQLTWLSGIPGTVRTLSVASNGITGLTSYSHLLNLENLDISRNDIESLNQLACLRHLRELKADGNKISSLEGLEKMESLVKISLQGNGIHSVNFAEYSWSRLEVLNLSQNKLSDVQSIASLQGLIALNLDNNDLDTLDVEHSMPKLRILRVSGNKLHQLHLGKIANLRTLYADNNALHSLVKLDRLTRLENLSLRNQSGRGINFMTREVRDVKRLYLSGNALQAGFITEPCYNLVYLELAACRLTALPEELSRLVPNLRVLNLNYNFLEDARPLEGLTRLRKLTMIGSRLKGTKPLIRLLQRMPEVEMLDFRMNPCTLGWYLPLLVRDVPGALQPSEEVKSNASWQELDSKFRRGLPTESYIGRLAYRGLIMRSCTNVRLIDGVEVTSKERRKAQQLLAGLLGDRK